MEVGIKYDDKNAIENKPTHFSPYIAVAALHFFKIFNDINFLKSIWSSIELAINFSVDLQQDNGTIPWSIDSNNEIENDFLLTGCSSILKVSNVLLQYQIYQMKLKI